MKSPVSRAGVALIAAILWPTATPLAATLTRAEYTAHKRQIEADYKLERTVCDRLTSNDKDICMARAQGREKVAKAELDFNNTGDEADRYRLSMAKADADRAVALERCDDRQGNERALCVKEAEAVHSKALVDARRFRQVGSADKDAAGDQRMPTTSGNGPL